MTASLLVELRDFIRRTDGGNRLSARFLGERIAGFLAGWAPDDEDEDTWRLRFADYVERINRDKSMGSGLLAAMVIEEFELEEER